MVYMKLGQWVAMSIIQDGFGFPVLTPPVYQYMVNGDINMKISLQDIAEPGIKYIVSLVSCHVDTR